MTLLKRFLSGDRVALARMISYVEDRSPDYHEVLARIFAHRRGAYRVGITGPPGAGKSSRQAAPRRWRTIRVRIPGDTYGRCWPPFATRSLRNRREAKVFKWMGALNNRG